MVMMDEKYLELAQNQSEQLPNQCQSDGGCLEVENQVLFWLYVGLKSVFYRDLDVTIEMLLQFE